MGCTFMKRGEASSKPKKIKSNIKSSQTSKRINSLVKTGSVKNRSKKKSTPSKIKGTKVVKPEGKRKKSAVTTPSQNQIKRLLSLREKVRKSRPKFLRQESWRYIRVGDAWRKPKGIDSKMRKEKKGWPAMVNVGYGGPVKSRGLHPSGFRDILINNMGDLEGLNPETDAVRLASSLGAKKRRSVLDRADELGLKVLNPQGTRVIISKE